MAEAEEPPNSWHLDKRIPIALILAVLAQTSAGVWWAATIEHRVQTAETRMTRLEVNEAKTAESAGRFDRTLATIVQSQDDMRRSLERIERRIDARQPSP
jgi:uncharacterized coiled-coil protein SlyX